jgi:ubiquinone/menaquinone biosynthesis C-methylase UbiE
MKGSMSPISILIRRRVVILLIALSAAIPARADEATPHAEATAAPFQATIHHSFDDVSHWVQVFDDPARAAWQKPADVVKALGLAPGMSVADIGAGTGYFEPYLSAAVAASGVVYAAEPEPKLLVHVRERAEKTGLANVIPVLCSADNPRLPPQGVDLVLIVDTFHHIDDRLGYFRRLRGVLRPAGRIAVIDWQKRPLPEGPPPEHKIARRQVIEEMQAAGYQLAAQHDLLPYQYFLVFRPMPEQ